MDCGASSVSQVRTTLYFGLARPKGSVTEFEWQILLRDEVTKRFPGPSRYGGGTAILAVIEAYRKTFEQQSVLWENARVCVAA